MTFWLLYRKAVLLLFNFLFQINKAINKIMALFCTFMITEVRKWYKKKEGGYVHITSITKNI
jgi:hypothetical protein